MLKALLGYIQRTKKPPPEINKTILNQRPRHQTAPQKGVLDIGYWRFPYPGHGIGLKEKRHVLACALLPPLGRRYQSLALYGISLISTWHTLLAWLCWCPLCLNFFSFVLAPFEFTNGILFLFSTLLLLLLPSAPLNICQHLQVF